MDEFIIKKSNLNLTIQVKSIVKKYKKFESCDTMNNDIDDVIYKSELISNRLTLRDMNIPLLSKLEKDNWLNNRHITQYLNLLKNQFPQINGLEDSCDLLNKKYKPVVGKSNIYIINIRSHWATITNMISNKDDWYLLDSLTGKSDRTTIKDFMGKITNKQKIVLNILSIKYVQQQLGFDDCGLFALAFTTSLCYKQKVNQLTFQQPLMRQHYRDCLKNGIATMFPTDPKLIINKTKQNIGKK